MNNAICNVSVAPLRKEPADASEMVSQLLFGESVVVLEKTAKWWKIKADFDGYEGWMDPKQLTPITEQEIPDLEAMQYAGDLYNLMLQDGLPATLTIGAHLVHLQNHQLQLGKQPLEYLGEVFQKEKSREKLVETAHLFLNVPYLWGGKSSFGIDCSGFVQQVFKLCDIKLPRDAYQQAQEGEVLGFVEEAHPGDLAYFDNEEGRIIHVGIVLANQKIIHAHGKVRIDKIDSTGIFNVDTQKYSHKLRFIKSLLP